MREDGAEMTVKTTNFGARLREMQVNVRIWNQHERLACWMSWKELILKWANVETFDLLMDGGTLC